MYNSEISNHFNNHYNAFHLNRKIVRKISDVSVSSLGSDLSDFSEDFGPTSDAILEENDVAESQDLNTGHSGHQQKLQRKRSNSLGSETTPNNTDDSNFEVFPSLPNSVLEKMGLLGDGPRERLSDEDLEQKFTSLSLAFAIDAATIKDRYERQRRHRDQTENNLTIEIDKLKDKLALIQPLCTDFHSAELLSILLSQVETIMRASSLVSNSAERYGAVQHEKRLTESVQLMVNHVQVLKQQRDSTRRQLQYTKRMLQSSSETSNSPTQKTTLPGGRKVITRRRASIATISQPTEMNININSNTNNNLDNKKMITRRISDLSVRASTSLNRNARPNRLELGVDLVKIKEGFVAEPPEVQEPNTEEESQNEETQGLLSSLNSYKSPVDLESISFLNQLKCRLRQTKEICTDNFAKWCQKDNKFEVFNLSAVFCIAMSIVIMINIFIEIRQASTWFSFWSNKDVDVSKNVDAHKK